MARASVDADDDMDEDEEHDIKISAFGVLQSIFSFIGQSVSSLITGSFRIVVNTVRKMLGMKDLDAIDPATGLTARQKKAIRDSWDIISEDTKGNGVEMLMKFFDEYPKDREFFSAFDGMTNEQLLVNVKLRAHATMVMNALSSIVDNLDDPGCLIIFLRKNARDHHGRSIGLIQYKHLFETFVRFIQEFLGEKKCRPLTKESWEKALKVVVSIIDTELTAITDT